MVRRSRAERGKSGTGGDKFRDENVTGGSHKTSEKSAIASRMVETPGKKRPENRS